MRTDQVRLSSVNQSGTEVKGACTGALTDASFPLPFMFPTFLHVSVVFPSFHPFLPLKFPSSLLCIFPIIHVLPFVCFRLSFPTSTQLLSSFFTSFQVSFSFSAFNACCIFPSFLLPSIHVSNITSCFLCYSFLPSLYVSFFLSSLYPSYLPCFLFCLSSVLPLIFAYFF